MSDTVWICTAPGHASNLRPFRNDIEKIDPEKFELSRNKVKYGLPVSSDEMPNEIFGISSAEEKDYRLPDLFRGYGYWVVSAEAAEVLRQFDLGAGGLYPVKVLKNDRQTRVGGEWYCINFGNQKRAFLPDESPRFRHSYIRNGQMGWYPRLPYKHEDFAVSRSALGGADVWVDPDVGDAFFFSDALAKALKKAKVDKGFMLGKCRVI
jgi:hypothetical protein